VLGAKSCSTDQVTTSVIALALLLTPSVLKSSRYVYEAKNPYKKKMKVMKNPLAFSISSRLQTFFTMLWTFPV